MAKKNYYCIKASKGNACDTISFEKDEDDMICICMEGEELRFTMKVFDFHSMDGHVTRQTAGCA